jgi:hypothetical protein
MDKNAAGLPVTLQRHSLTDASWSNFRISALPGIEKSRTRRAQTMHAVPELQP